MIIAGIWIMLRLQHSKKHLLLDDYCLIFSCICLTAATVLLYVGLTDIYVMVKVSFNDFGAIGVKSYFDLQPKILFLRQINEAYVVLV